CKGIAKFKYLRFVVLALSSLLLVGGYYSYDNPAYLNLLLQDWMKTDSKSHQYQIASFYTAYSIPNIVLPFFGGMMVDKWGNRKLIISFSLIVCAGQLMFAVATAYRSFIFMLLGRILLGIGLESLGVAQTTFITSWFRGQECAFALGIVLSVSRFGNVLNDNLTPYVASRFNVPISLFVSFILCIFSFISGLFLIAIDWAVKEYNKSTSPRSIASTRDEDEKSTTESTTESKYSTYFSQVKNLNSTFWLSCLCVICYYGATTPFNNISSQLLQAKWKVDPEEAGSLMSITDTLSAISVPFFGLVFDNYGFRSVTMIISGVFIGLFHCLISFTHFHPSLPLTILGLCYGMFASSFWSSISLLVPPSTLASAYGIATGALNGSLSIAPLFVAYLVSYDYTYAAVEMAFLIIIVFGTILAIIIRLLDKGNDNVLDKPEKCMKIEHEIDETENLLTERCLSLNTHLWNR
ncbi:MFS general substrate transporter, partial [Rozella allomycis CSF55]